MFEIRVEANFSAAHFLQNYNGKCENLHGHNYKVLAHVRGENLNEGGMLLDFSILKRALKEVCASLDHTNLNDIDFFKQNPSAEKIALFVYENLIKKMKEAGINLQKNASGTFLYAVDVFETKTNRARYKID